jgi:hypothetical protein
VVYLHIRIAFFIRRYLLACLDSFWFFLGVANLLRVVIYGILGSVRWEGNCFVDERAVLGDNILNDFEIGTKTKWT